MKKNIIIAAVLLLGLVFFIWRSQPKQVIKRQSEELISMADKISSGVGLFDFNKLESLLAPQVDFEVEEVSSERQTVGSVEVISAYQWLGDNIKKSEFKVVSIDSIQIKGDAAKVKMQVKGLLEIPEMRMMDDTYFVELAWESDDKGDWRLTELIWE